MGSDGGREFQNRVLEGLRPASLIREAVVGQMPLFIELCCLRFYVHFSCGLGSREVGGHGGECKEAGVQRMPVGDKKGTQTNKPDREETGLGIRRKRADF